MNWNLRYASEEFHIMGTCEGPDCHHCAVKQEEIDSILKPPTSGDGKKPKITTKDRARAKAKQEALKTHRETRNNVI